MDWSCVTFSSHSQTPFMDHHHKDRLSNPSSCPSEGLDAKFHPPPKFIPPNNPSPMTIGWGADKGSDQIGLPYRRHVVSLIIWAWAGPNRTRGRKKPSSVSCLFPLQVVLAQNGQHSLLQKDNSSRKQIRSKWKPFFCPSFAPLSTLPLLSRTGLGADNVSDLKSYRPPLPSKGISSH